MDPLVLTVLIGAFGLATLVFVMVLVAARADHQVTIRGPMATLEELDRQIDTKRGTLVDLDDDLKQRREALANVAGIQAEVDALVRQREDLLTEHQQLEHRRAEVLAVREETEEAFARRAEATRNLAETVAELEHVQTELSGARRLVGEIEAMTERHETLSDKVSKLRTQVAELEALLGQEDSLRRRLPELEREAARLDGEIEARRSRREDAEAAAQSAEERLRALQAKHVEVAAALAVASQKSREWEDKVEGLQKRRTELEARVARLDADIREMEKKREELAKNGKDDDEDKLAELTRPPQCLVAAKNSGWTKPLRARSEIDALGTVEDSLRHAGLTFGQRTIYAFHTALKVADISPMTALAGISGTGKSQLPRAYAAAMGIHFLQVPVQPRWDSPQDLMGFYNFVDKRYRATDLSRLLAHLDSENWPDLAGEWKDRMALVLLDEMNLARTEYYFSEFLSRLEMRPRRNENSDPARRADAEIELDIPGESNSGGRRIYAGYRVLFAGTMNEDESTQALSDKVLDRSNVLRFTQPEKLVFDGDGTHEAESVNGYLDAAQWERWIDEATQHGDKESIESAIETLNRILGDAQRGFGHRMAQAIERYARQYPSPDEWRIAIADQVEMRVLPKLRGVDLADSGTERALKELDQYTTEELHDQDLGEAIRRDVSAGQQRGLFAWTGLDRKGHGG